MSDGSSRRTFLKTTGLAALGIGCGVPLVRALASELEADTGPGPRWAMLVDTRKCAAEDGCTRCAEACHVAHNVPRIDDVEEEVKWIWKESFQDVFPAESHAYLDAEVRERPVPVLCNQCDNPPCVRVCPTQATWKREDGIVMMDMHRCIGCRYCIVGCPYGARSFNWQDPRPHIEAVRRDFPTRTTGVVEKCNFCVERGRESPDGTWTPTCVEACPAKALMFGNVRDPSSEIRRVMAERITALRKPDLGTRPHVFYLV